MNNIELKDKKIYWCVYIDNDRYRRAWLYQYKYNNDGFLTNCYLSFRLDDVLDDKMEIFENGRIVDEYDFNEYDHQNCIIREATQKECLLFCFQLIKHGYEYDYETNTFK